MMQNRNQAIEIVMCNLDSTAYRTYFWNSEQERIFYIHGVKD